MKVNRLSFIVRTALCCALILFPTTAPAAEKVVVAVSQIVEHPALDACRNGLLDGLKDAGFIEGKNLVFDFKTAQGNPTIATQIAKQFVGDAPDVLVGIATPSAQALAAATKTIPVIFSAVTDPVGAKLLTNMDAPNGNVTGLSDLSPIAQHIEIMRAIVPNLKTIGVVYNPGEANAISLLKLLRKEAAKHGIRITETTASRSAEVKSATQAVAGKSQIIYAMTDNTIASAITALTQAATDAKVPVFGGATSYVEAGAVAAVGFDYYQVGYQTADYVVGVLQGKKIADMPARTAKGTDIYINPSVAKKIGITLPAMLTDNPTKVIGE